MPNTESNIIIYNSIDGKASVALYAKDGKIWLNQKQLAELFATSVPNINIHISNILKENELDKNSVIKDYLITASDGKKYNVTFYSLEMILAVGYKYFFFSLVENVCQHDSPTEPSGVKKINGENVKKALVPWYATGSITIAWHFNAFSERH